MTIRAGGLASGLDTNSIIEQLVSIERQPIRAMESKKASVSNQISIYGKLKAAFTKVLDKLKALDTVLELGSFAASSSNEKAFTTKADGMATKGDYDVTVGALAKSAKMRSVGISNASPTVKAGTLSVTVRGGDPQTVAIEEGESLTAVAERFNQTVTGAFATIINDGTNSYLSITAEKSGHTAGLDPSTALAVTESYTGATGSELGLTTTQAAQNASLTIDGLAVTSESNEVTTAIPGVTLSLLAPTAAAEKLTVKGDAAAMETKIKEFVDAYNEAIDLITKETTVVENTARDKTLAGDAAVRGLRGEFSALTSAAVSSLAGKTFDNIAAFGIKTSRSGKLELDSAALKTAVAKDPMAVVRVFTNADGIAKRVKAGLERYTGTDGVFKARTDGLNAQIKSFDKRIDDLGLRAERYETLLIRQFGALEKTASAWTAQGNYLANALR